MNQPTTQKEPTPAEADRELSKKLLEHCNWDLREVADWHEWYSKTIAQHVAACVARETAELREKLAGETHQSAGNAQAADNWLNECRTLNSEVSRLREALTGLAQLDNESGNARLAENGSYGLFDEPCSVQVARAALSPAPAEVEAGADQK